MERFQQGKLLFSALGKSRKVFAYRVYSLTNLVFYVVKSDILLVCLSRADAEAAAA